MYQSFLLALNRVHPRTWDFVQLMRLEKPIGIYLLLWPTLWALWVASKGVPDFKWPMWSMKPPSRCVSVTWNRPLAVSSQPVSPTCPADSP